MEICKDKEDDGFMSFSSFNSFCMTIAALTRGSHDTVTSKLGQVDLSVVSPKSAGKHVVDIPYKDIGLCRL